MSKYHIAEIIDESYSFVQTGHVTTLIEGYGFNANTPVFEHFLFEMLRDYPSSFTFSELWSHLRVAHHNRKQTERFRQNIKMKLENVQFGGPIYDKISGIMNKVKRTFDGVEEDEEEEESPKFTTEKINTYNSYYKILHDPDKYLPQNPSGAYFSLFSVSFQYNPNAILTMESKAKMVRSAIIRIIKGSAKMSDYYTFEVMKNTALSEFASRGTPINYDHFVNASDPIDILEKLIFSNIQGIEDTNRATRTAVPPTPLSADEVRHVNFLFRQIHDPDNDDFIFDGVDIDKFLLNYYNTNQYAVKYHVDLNTLLGNMSGSISESNAYVENRHQLLRRIMVGEGTKDDYKTLGNFLDIAKPLQLLHVLVLPKSRIAEQVIGNKIQRSEARRALNHDVVVNRTLSERVQSEKQRLKKEIADVKKARQETRAYDIAELEKSISPEIATAISKFVTSIRDSISRTKSAFLMESLPMFTQQSNFYTEQHSLFRLDTTDVLIDNRNRKIYSTFNNLLHLYSLLEVPTNVVDKDVIKNIYKLVFPLADTNPIPINDKTTNADIVHHIYNIFKVIMEESIVSQTTMPVLNQIDLIINNVIDQISIKIDPSERIPSRVGWSILPSSAWTPPQYVNWNTYINVEKVIVSLKNMINILEFDSGLSLEQMFDLLKDTLRVYEVTLKKEELRSKDKHYLSELIRNLLDYEKSEIYDSIPNQKQYKRITTVEQNIYNVIENLWRPNLIQETKVLTQVDEKYNEISKIVEALETIVQTNLVHFSYRFQGLFEFFNTCIKYEKNDDIQEYSDIYNQFSLESPYPESIINEDKLYSILNFMKKTINEYKVYKNYSRALQILTWIGLYMDETLADLKKANEILNQPPVVEQKKELYKGYKKYRLDNMDVYSQKMIFPSIDDLFMNDRKYKSMQELMDDDLENVLHYFESIIVLRNNLLPLTQENAHVLIIKMGKIVALVRTLTPTSDSYESMKFVFETVDFSQIELRSIITDVNDSDENIYNAIRNFSITMSDIQKRMVKVFAIVMIYNAFHLEDEDLKTLYVRTEVSSDNKQEIDYDLRDAKTIPSGSRAEFYVQWDIMINTIKTIKEGIGASKNRGQLNNVFYQYIDFATKAFLSVLHLNETPRMSTIPTHISDETMSNEILHLKTLFDDNHNQSNQIALTNVISSITPEMDLFFKDNIYFFENEEKLSPSEDAFYDFTSIYDHINSSNFINVYSMQHEINELRKQYGENISGEISTYFIFGRLLLRAIKANGNVRNLEDVVGLIKKDIRVKIEENNIDQSKKSENLFIKELEDVDTNIQLIVIALIAIKMQHYFPIHATVVNEKEIIIPTPTINWYNNSQILTLSGSWDRLIIIGNYLLSTFGVANVVAIFWRYMKYLYKIFKILLDNTQNMNPERVIQYYAVPRNYDQEFGPVPSNVSGNMVNEIYKSIQSLYDDTLQNPSFYADMVYIIGSKLEMFVMKNVHVRFGGKVTPSYTDDLDHMFDILRCIETIDLYTILIHYTQCIELGREIVSMKYDLFPTLELSIPDEITTIPDNYDVVEFVRLLLLDDYPPEDRIYQLLRLLSSILSVNDNAKLHNLKGALAKISTIRVAFPKLRYLQCSFFPVPYDALPAEKVVPFLSECVQLLYSTSPKALAEFKAKARESIFIGLNVY